MSEKANQEKTVPRETDDTQTVGGSEASQLLRRRDLTTLGGTFTESLQPLKEILAEMKGLNLRYSTSNQQLHRVTRFQQGITLVSIVSLMVLLFTVVYVWQALGVLKRHTQTLQELEGKVTAQAAELVQLKGAAMETRQQVAEVKQEQDENLQLELVPETDPVKARKSPVKLQVKAPRHSKAAPSTSVPTHDAGVPSKSVLPSMAEIPLSSDVF